MTGSKITSGMEDRGLSDGALEGAFLDEQDLPLAIPAQRGGNNNRLHVLAS